LACTACVRAPHELGSCFAPLQQLRATGEICWTSPNADARRFVLDIEDLRITLETKTALAAASLGP